MIGGVARERELVARDVELVVGSLGVVCLAGACLGKASDWVYEAARERDRG